MAVDGSSKRPKLDPDTGIVSTSSDPREWTTVKSVMLTKCLHSLTPDLISLSKETLTELTFSDYTLFKNIKRCLKALTNLKHLSFNDIFIDAYHRFLYTKIIEAPTIESLSLIRSTKKLTNSEYFLLDFFTRGANLSGLNKIAIRLPQSHEQQESQQFNNNDQTVEKTRNETEKAIELTTSEETPFLSRFLIKYRSSLRQLNISGTGLKIWDPAETKEQTIANLGTIQLEDFIYSMDDAGQNFIMERQRILKNFTWDGLSKDWNQKRLNQLFSSLSNNADTLTSINLISTVVLPNAADKDQKDDQDLFEVNCESFSKLNNLNKLEIAIQVKNLERGYTQWAPLVSVHLLPPNLQSLLLHSHEFSSEELIMLLARMPTFKNLQTIHFERDSKQPFAFSAVWLQALVELPEIQNVSFKGVTKTEEVTRAIEHAKQSTREINIAFDT